MQQPESSCRDCCRIRSSPFQTERSVLRQLNTVVRPGPTLTNPTPSNHPGAKAEPETSPGRSSYPTIPTSHFRTYRTAFPLPHTCALLYAALALSLHRVAHKLYACGLLSFRRHNSHRVHHFPPQPFTPPRTLTVQAPTQRLARCKAR